MNDTLIKKGLVFYGSILKIKQTIFLLRKWEKFSKFLFSLIMYENL